MYYKGKKVFNILKPVLIDYEEAIGFAEEERQKSKNLWANGDVSGTLYKEIKLINPIPAGTYTISFVHSSSDTHMNYAQVIFYSSSGTAVSYLYPTRDSRWSKTFTITEPIAKVFFYASSNYGNSEGDTFSYTDIMITTDGSTDYQPYNGAIVHEKELNEQIETRELLYDWYKKIDITNSTLTTLQEYFDLFEKNPNETYFCKIGTLDTSNFKVLHNDISHSIE